jgi:hypothetical protein
MGPGLVVLVATGASTSGSAVSARKMVAHSGGRFGGADVILIEAKASGLDVINEMRRLYAHEKWNVCLTQSRRNPGLLAEYGEQGLHVTASQSIHVSEAAGGKAPCAGLDRSLLPEHCRRRRGVRTPRRHGARTAGGCEAGST